MILNGKAKEDFLKWLLTEGNEIITNGTIEYDLYYMVKYMIPENMVNAKIIEWFDSVGIYICLENHYKNFGYKIQDKGNVVLYDHMFAIHSRQEDTKQAIIKANEIYN